MFMDDKVQKEYTVWDPFMGTGTTGNAAMLLDGVKFYGSELDDNCFKVQN